MKPRSTFVNEMNSKPYLSKDYFQAPIIIINVLSMPNYENMD
jgi:hypothetical protein